MRRIASKTWRPLPLPLTFHNALDTGHWTDALSIYNANSSHVPVMDTYELLRAILINTSLSVGAVKHRFESRMKAQQATKRRPPEEIEWNTFWEALNNGDSRTISMSLSGARVVGVDSQMRIAEACAVLLHHRKENWYETLVDNVPFATVTANNLVAIAIREKRPDVALEMLPHLKLSRSDAVTLWPTVKTLGWQTALEFFFGGCRPFAADFVDDLLGLGADITIIAEMLERAKLLQDKRLVSKLIINVATRDSDPSKYHKKASLSTEEFVKRCFEHLGDLDCIPEATLRAVLHKMDAVGCKALVQTLVAENVQPHELTMVKLEAMRLA